MDLHVRPHAGPSCDQSLVNEAFHVETTTRHVLFRDWGRTHLFAYFGVGVEVRGHKEECVAQIWVRCVEEVITPTQCREVCAVIRANWFPGRIGRESP